ncbi:MAG TPA: hemin uptake protein HemP [Kiritimatiellia bacterium]|nr:hemin uptake protein HemP [Kiritimatiellia bacterium]
MSGRRNSENRNATEAAQEQHAEVIGLVLETKRLFARRKVVTLRHEGTDYRLCLTRNGKLLLNK